MHLWRQLSLNLYRFANPALPICPAPCSKNAHATRYLLKDVEPEQLVDAVRRALKGETVVAPAMTLKLVELLHPRRAGNGRVEPVERLAQPHHFSDHDQRRRG
jgi:DNA-binding NarL/FixJ family response regulator